MRTIFASEPTLAVSRFRESRLDFTAEGNHTEVAVNIANSSEGASKVGTPIAEFRGVTKWYGAVIGVNDITVPLHPGITGLLGPNGAGKSTLIKLLTGLLKPSLGEIRVCGKPAWSAAAKRHVGYCPETDAFYEEMSGRRFVRTMARLHGMSRAEVDEHSERALAEVGMTDRAGRALRGYSKGMRQRIRLASTGARSDLLVVDEPLNGVDPVGRRDLDGIFPPICRSGSSRARLQPHPGRDGRTGRPHRIHGPRPRAGHRHRPGNP